MRVAIHRRVGVKTHTGLWTHAWEKFCLDKTIDYELVDCFSPGAIRLLKDFDVLLFHFENYVYNDMKHARSILYSAKKMGLKIFPDFSDCWHFDDKIAESILLDAISAPVPEYFIFFSKDDFSKWLENSPKFPVVAKLKAGSGSHNVKMLNTLEDAKKYSSIMFGKGFSSSPNPFYKASSNIKSVKSISEFKKRFKRIPEFLRTLRQSSEFEKEKGYVYLQEFVDNPGYDIKVVVVGDKVSYFVRRVRPGDFRASGGADFYYDRAHVPMNVVESALAVSKRLGVQCMGYDYVVDQSTGKGLIVEMSYGFSHKAVLGAGGHWDSNFEWIEEPLNAPEEIIKNMLKKNY